VLVEATCKPCLAAKGSGDDQKKHTLRRLEIFGGEMAPPKCHSSFPAYETSNAPEAVSQQDKTLYFMKQYYERPGCHNTGISGILQSKHMT